MPEQQTLRWKRGTTDSTTPPQLADPQFVEQEEQPLVSLYRRYGPVFCLPQSGNSSPLIILAGPEMNVFMSRYEDEFFTTRENWQQFDTQITQERGGITEARDGAANRQRRASSSRQWSRARILDQIPQMIALVRKHTQDWQSGTSIAVHASMRRLVAEQLGCLLLGYSPGDYLDDFVLYLNTTIANTLRQNSDARVPFYSAAYQRAKERVNEFSRQVYEYHLSHPQPNGKPDMVDDAIAQVAHLPAEQHRAALGMIALGPMLAGLDTVANSLSFALYALLAFPEVHQRVQEEADAAFSMGSLTWEKLRHMRDLHGMMMETMRRYPVANPHHARVSHPLTIAGYRLEPGDEVAVAMTVPHFLEELYSHPMQFDIDRFREPRNEHRKPGAYAPFGLGDHTCLDAGIAEVQLMVTLATLLHSFRFQFDPPAYQLVIEQHPNAVPGNQFRVTVKRELDEK